MTKFKVQLPDYPCHYIVTNLTTARGAGGKLLHVAEAQFVRPGLSPRPCSDLVTLMLLHDAVITHVYGSPRTERHLNKPILYGRSKINQVRSQRRIAGATVEELSTEKNL